jgi:hypothetical protein
MVLATVLAYCMILHFDFFYLEDPLKNARYLIVDIFQIKLVKLLLLIALAINVILFVVQTYLFLEKFDKYYFVLYAPLYFGTFFVSNSTKILQHLI